LGVEAHCASEVQPPDGMQRWVFVLHTSPEATRVQSLLLPQPGTHTPRLSQ